MSVGAIQPSGASVGAIQAADSGGGSSIPVIMHPRIITRR